MFNYSAHPAHFTIPGLMMVIAESILHTSWTFLGQCLYGLAFVTAACITYAFIEEVRRASTNTKETRTNDEQDERVHELQSVRVEMWETQTQSRYFTLSASPSQMEQLATGLLAGDPISEKRWTGKHRPFSVNQFRILRGEMIEHRLIYPVSDKDNRQGYALTETGRRYLSKYIPSPTLQVLDPEIVDR